MSSPTNPGSGSSGQGAISQMEVLNDDSSTSEEVTIEEEGGEVTSEESEEETSTTSDDEDSDEEESEESTEEEEGLEEEEETSETEEPTQPSWKLIKEKYPELAKDKNFREIYYRDKAFTDLYPTVADAKEASVKAEALDILDNNLVGGNLDEVFKGLNPEVLGQLADKLLPALYNTDSKAYKRAAQPLILDVFHNVLDAAKKAGDKNLEISIRNISRHLTGNPELPNRITSPTANPQVEAELNKLRTERQNLYKTQENNFLASANRGAESKLLKIISSGLDNEKSLTLFAKQAVIEKTYSDLAKVLVSDEGLRNKLRQVHKLAARSGFPEEFKARIISASLARATKLIPSIRNKHVQAALGKQPSKGTKSGKVVVNSQNGKVTTGENQVVSSSGKGSKIDMRKTSAVDFLNDKVTFRK